MTQDDSFRQLEQIVRSQSVVDALHWLEQQFTQQKRHAELFEILKMKCRHQVGLPLLSTGDAFAADVDRREELERLMYKACGQVGELLFREGNAAMAWKYFQLVGDRARAAELLKKIEINDDNVSEIIGVAVDAGVDPHYGIELILRHQGTCNAITAYDRQIAYESNPVRQRVAENLVAHLYDELQHNVRGAIERAAASSGAAIPGADTSLKELVESRPWLFASGFAHIDVSHLGSVVRIARLVTDPELLRRAVELADYGCRLDPQLRMEGDYPFTDHFGDHRVYYAARASRDFGSAIELFRSRFETAGSNDVHQRLAAEIVIDLFLHASEFQQALDWSLKHLRGNEGSLGLAPSAVEIARQGKLLSKLADWSREHQNPLLHAVALLVGAGDAA